MKHYYRILSCFSFEETDKVTKEKTWKIKYCIKWNQLLQNGFMSQYTFSYFLSEEEFVDKFWKFINTDTYDFGLQWKIMEVVFVWNPSWIVDSIPEKKNTK